MNKLLINLFFDGYTIKEAIEFLQRAYQETPTQDKIEQAKRKIKAGTNKERN